eukprot:Skav208811  [mRNA]  locus=scaffold349:230535:234052:- [translate_table: standard]
MLSAGTLATLEQRSYKRMQKVSVRAMLLCCFVYLLMGVTGFLAFGENTNGNVLGNLQPMLCANDWIVRSGVAGMAFAVTMAYPLNIFPIRFSVETALFYHKPHLDLPGMRTGIGVAAVACSLLAAIVAWQKFSKAYSWEDVGKAMPRLSSCLKMSQHIKALSQLSGFASD